MSRYSILIDVAKCSGCYNCFLSCRDEHYGNDYPGYSVAQPAHGQFWLQVTEIERGEYPKPKVDYVVKPCLHCQDAPCIDAAKDGAVYRREDGIVMLDPDKAKGQEGIVNACPYRVIYWNAEAKVPQKCNLCAHRLDQGERLPRCVDACPTGAMVFGDLDDPESEIAKLAADKRVEDLRPEFATKPLVRYLGIPKRFVTGEVVLQDKEDECSQGITVKLNGPDGERRTVTDLFGDFEFDGLAKNQQYTLTVAADGYSECRIELQTVRDINLDEIVLYRR